MANFTVTPEALLSAAKRLETEALNYENASKVAKASADALAANWEGDSQKAFVQEQEKAYTWYIAMAELARQYSRFLTQAADTYRIADQQASGVIQSR